jgi:hypothetical protein
MKGHVPEEMVYRCIPFLSSPAGLMTGRRRRREVIAFLEQFRCATSEQLTALFFRTTAGRKKCQERMRKYQAEGLIKAKRIGKENVYYTGQWPQHYEHHMGIVDAYIEIKKELTYHTFEYFREYDLSPEIRTDLFIVGKNYVTGEPVLIAAEVERATNPIRPKLEKYLRLYLSDAWLNESWAKYGNISLFPKIYVLSQRDITWMPKELKVKVIKT